MHAPFFFNIAVWSICAIESAIDFLSVRLFVEERRFKERSARTCRKFHEMYNTRLEKDVRKSTLSSSLLRIVVTIINFLCFYSTIVLRRHDTCSRYSNVFFIDITNFLYTIVTFVQDQIICHSPLICFRERWHCPLKSFFIMYELFVRNERHIVIHIYIL